MSFEHFQSHNHPDGGVQNGAMAQEECLCHSSDNWALSQTLRGITLPSGRVLKSGKQFDLYLKWKRSNPYFGKQFSILGDSISTLDGYNPKGYNLFYTGDTCYRTGVHEMKDTWWGKVIDYFGGELLVNNSWSGSRVTKLPNRNTPFPPDAAMSGPVDFISARFNPKLSLSILERMTGPMGCKPMMAESHGCRNEHSCNADAAENV